MPLRAKPVTPARTGRALTAAAAPIRLDDDKTRAAWRKRNQNQSWQQEAWGYFDDIGEIKFAMTLVGNWARKIRLFPATQPDPDQPPVPVDSPDSGISPQLAALAIAELDRLRSDEGSHGPLMATLLVNLSISGEAILLGEQDPETGEEAWKVYSTDELIADTAGAWKIRVGPDARDGRPVAPDASVTRLWREHPRFSDWPDSNMRGVLDRCDELLILSKLVRSSGRSRLNSGILFAPTEADLGALDPTIDGDNTNEPAEFIRDLVNALSEPIHQEGSAAGVVPILVRVPKDLIQFFVHMDFARPLDAAMAAQRNEAIERIAAGLDMPAEVLLGLGHGHVNHWSSDVIDEQAFKAHFQPIVELGCGALSKGFMTPTLNLDGEDPTGIFIWYDPSQLIGHPNREAAANDGHDRFTISDETWRRVHGFSEDDAPSDVEIEAMIRRKTIIRVTDRLGGTGADGAGATPGESPTEIIGPANVGGAANGSSAVSAAVLPPARALRAAAQDRVAVLGGQLAQVDHDVTVRVSDAASFTLNRALEVAGSRLASRVQGQPELANRIKGVDRAVVAAMLGPSVFAVVHTTDDELLAGALVPLQSRYESLVLRAQDRARALLAQQDRNDAMDDEALLQVQEDHRAAGWVALSTGLLTLAAERLFDPHPAAPPVGEFDTSSSVPAGLIRESLARAGGATGRATAGGAVLEADRVPAGGVATGPDVLQQLAAASIFVAGYTWTVGAPDRPFEPHQLLGDEFFTSWDDERLANNDSWPDTDFLFPGDHDGCQCLATPTLVQADEAN